MVDDGHRAAEEFDGYVVDTRRKARWTESRRRAEDPADHEDAREARDARDDVARTRVMPAVEPASRGERRTAADPRDRPDGPRRGSTRLEPGRPVRPRPAAGTADERAHQVRAYRDQPRTPTGSTRVVERRRRPRVRWGRLVALLVALWLAFLVVTPLHAWSQSAQVDTTPAGERPTVAGGHNYLLLGSDSRAGLDEQDRSRLGAGAADGQRTDSIILVHVPGHGGKPALVSIPRDSYVPVPGYGSHKINAAYSLGGPRLLTQTVEQVGDIRIDGVLEIGFAGFADVVDSVGGVTLCPQWAMKDPEAGIDLQPGCQRMDGPTALGYVRTRHTDPRGDLGRADRQREFLGALMSSAVSPSTLLPWRYWAFTHAAARSVQRSTTLGVGDVAQVLQAMRGTGSGDTLSLMMPIESMGYATRDGSAVKWNSAQAEELFRMIREDEPMQSPPPGTVG